MNEIMRLLNVDPLLLQALREDMPGEDVSTNAVMPCACPGTVDLIAKQDGIVAGLDVFARVFTLLDPATEVEFFCKDGDAVKNGEKLGVVNGDIRVLLSGERRYKALNYLQARGDAKWNTVKNCRVVTTPLSDNEKKVMLLSANLQVRGGFANEMIRRKAVAELVSCLQAEPYNLTAAEAKKAIKEATPINGRQIDKDLSIEKNLNEGLKDLLDRGFVLRSEAESFLRMTPEEQRIAAQMLQQLYAIAYNGPGSAAIQDEKKAIRGRFVDALRTVADTSSMQDAHEALVAAVFTVQKEMACLKETIRKVKAIPPEQPAAQVEQTEVIREVREKTAGAKAQSKITGKLSSQTSRLETMLRRKNPEKRLAEKYTHEERRQAMKELDEMIATATRLREIIAKVERSADEAQEV